MRIAFVAALLAATAVAQGEVCVSGRVAPVTGPTICMQGETHFLENTRVFLKSSTVNLGQWVGQLVRVRGADVGVTCRVIEVREIGLALAALSWCGSSSPSCRLKLTMCPGGLGRWWLWAAFAPGYLPVDCAGPGSIDGTVLIGGLAVNLVFGQMIGACGEYSLSVPNDPSLIGLQVWFQGARQDVGPLGPIYISNVEVITLRPLLPPCAPTNC